MKALRVYETRIEIHPYNLGEFPEIECACSTAYDKVTHKRKPIGFYYDKEASTLTVPRGINIAWLSQLTGAYPTYYNGWDIENMRERYSISLKPKNANQYKAIYFLLQWHEFMTYVKYSQFVLTVEPGFGKTYCALVAALQRGKRTIIILPSSKIKEQWITTIKKYTKVNMNQVLDLVGCEKMLELLKGEVKYDIIVTLHQTITNFLNEYGFNMLKEFFNHLQCGTKIIDEAHLFFENTLAIDFCSNIPKNYYLSATFTRSDPLEINLFRLCFANAVQYGSELGVTKNVVYTFVYYNSSPSEQEQIRIKTAYGTSNYRFIDYALKRDKNLTILDAFFHTLKMSKEHEGKTLVIVPKVENCEFFAKLIQGEYPEDIVGTVHSKHKKEENFKIIEESTILISTFGSLGTGSDISGLRNLIVCDIFSSSVISRQLPKRLRPLENGELSYCYEVVDSGFEAILDMVRRKKKYIKRIAHEINEVHR